MRLCTSISLLQCEADQSREVARDSSCAGCVVVATVVGFTWGGWTTGGSAQDMADKAAASARQELAAVVCVDRFMAAPDAGVQLTALQEITSSYAQGKFVEEGGWAIIVPASSTADRKARAPMTARRPGCAPRSLPSVRFPRPRKPRRSTTRRPWRNSGAAAQQRASSTDLD